MKKFSILLLTIIAFTGFTSCEHEDDVVFVAQPDPEGVIFINDFASNYTLATGISDNLAERFVWNEVDFDAPTTVTYELQGTADSGFESFDVIGTTAENNLGVTIGQMRALAVDAGLDNDPNTEMPNTGQVYFRVRAYAGAGEGNSLEHTSEPVSLTVTLPEVGVEEEEETKTKLFLVGDATAAGWNPDNNNTPMFRDPENDNLFYYTGYLTAGNVKFLEAQGWAPQYGSEDGTNLVYRATEADPDPSPIPVASEGYYSITVDLDAMTVTMEPYDASSATAYEVVGVIGTATTGTDEGWNDDIDMTQSEFNPHLWYVNDIELFDGEMKFRANNAWDVSWGASTELSGQGANNNDPNIPVTAGTYDIWFNDLTNRYLLIPIVEEE